jgi:ribosomal protein L23
LYSTLIGGEEKYTFYVSVKAKKEEISDGEAEN